MPLATGDVVVLTDASDEQWWFGHRLGDDSVAGAFPASFVTPHGPAEEAPQEHAEASGGAAATVEMEVECPEGVEAGMMILLTTPDGSEVEVAVPEGVRPGDVFIVPVHSAAEEVEGSGTAAEEVEGSGTAPGGAAPPDGLALEAVKGRYKLVLLGAAKAGKSALYRSIIGAGAEGLNPDEYSPTLGLEHQKVQIEAHHAGHFRKEMTVEVSLSLSLSLPLALALSLSVSLSASLPHHLCLRSGTAAGPSSTAQ